MTPARLSLHAGLLLWLTHSIPATGETTHAVLPPADASALKAAHHAAVHTLRPDRDGTWVARNPGQRWATTFDGRAFLTNPDDRRWTWGLALESWGRPGDEQPVTGQPTPTAAGGRLEYNWGGLIREWFVNDARGLEHGWTVPDGPEAPDSAGQAVEPGLVVTLTVSGGLVPQIEPSGDTLTVFLQRDGAWTQQAYLKASNAEAGDGLGIAVAVAGSTVVAGADREDSAATTVGGSQTGNSAGDAGAAYVFAGIGNPLLEVARSAATVTLRWPAESAGWSLEASDSLQGSSWAPVTGIATLENAQRVLTLPVDRPRRFFRLR